MDELETNPLYQAFLTKFRREYDIACIRSYVIAIPTSDSLENTPIDQFLANSHILLPSKLLRMHYNSLQAGLCEDIELDGKKLICYKDKRKTRVKVVVNILAEEIGYNTYNKEFRTLLIDRPILLADQRPVNKSLLLSPSSSTSSINSYRYKPPRKLRDHDDCSKYLEFLSQELTTEFELDLKRLQSNYIILSQYLNDAADRIRDLTEQYVSKYESVLRNELDVSICDSLHPYIRLAVENHAVHLLHGKLMAAIFVKHERDDEKLQRNFEAIQKSRLSICQLGAKPAFSDFAPSSELYHELSRLPNLQSPLAVVSCLSRSVSLVTECLTTSVGFKRMMGGDDDAMGESTTICSDDLIASFVHTLAQLKLRNLFSLAKYLGTFGWSSTARDQAAYDAATIQIAIQYVHSYEVSAQDRDDNKSQKDLHPLRQPTLELFSKEEPTSLIGREAGDHVDSLDPMSSSPIVTGVSPAISGNWELL